MSIFSIESWTIFLDIFLSKVRQRRGERRAGCPRAGRRAGRRRVGGVGGGGGDAEVCELEGHGGAAEYPEHRHRYDHSQGVPQDDQADRPRFCGLCRAQVPQPGGGRAEGPVGG